MITMSNASSHQNSSSWPTSPNVAAQEEKKATLIPKEISSIMPGALALISAAAPVRNGRPPQTYITVPRTAAIQVPQEGTEYPRRLANIGENATTGIPRIRLIQNSLRNSDTWSP